MSLRSTFCRTERILVTRARRFLVTWLGYKLSRVALGILGTRMDGAQKPPDMRIRALASFVENFSTWNLSACLGDASEKIGLKQVL